MIDDDKELYDAAAKAAGWPADWRVEGEAKFDAMAKAAGWPADWREKGQMAGFIDEYGVNSPKDIIGAIEEGSQVIDPIKSLTALMNMKPEAKRLLSHMLDGFVKYEPEKWREWWLE